MAREVVSIQYLRGIAALMVVFSHANAQFQSPTHMLFRNIGWSGVDLFFVISGFVMTYITSARPMSSGEFLRRRIARIAPLYWVMTAFTAALVLLAPRLFDRSQFSPLELATSLLFIPFRNPGSGDIAPLLKLGWTLNYEMFFYLCFAALLFLKPLRRIAALFCVFGALVAIETISKSKWAPIEFYGSPMTFEFILGCAIGWAYESGSMSKISAKGALALLVLAALGLTVGGMTPDLDAREINRGIPAAMVVFGLLALEQKVHFQSKWLHAVGDATYSIYLTHLFIVLGLFRLVRSASPHSVLSYVFPVVAMTVCAMVGIWVYRIVEQRLIAAAKQTFVFRSAGLAA